MSKKTPQKRLRVKKSNSVMEIRTREWFEKTLLVVDSVVTGAMAAGMPPESFNSLLSYLFLHFASQRVSDHERLLERWTSPDCYIWQDVLCAARKFIDEFDGPLYQDRELEELDYLRNECAILPIELSEFEAKRHAKVAFPIIQWIRIRLAQIGGIPTLVAELAVLVVWFKTRALDGEIDDQAYYIVRQNPDGLFSAYRRAIEGSI